jgi:putative transposase
MGAGFMKVLGRKSSKSKRELPRFRDIGEMTGTEIARLAAHAALIDEFNSAKRSRTRATRHSETKEEHSVTRTREGAAKIAAAMGISVQTFYRRRIRLEETGLIAALDRPRTSGGRGKSRLPPEVEAIVQRELKKFQRKDKGQKISQFVKNAAKAIEAAGLSAPDPDTIRNRFINLSKRKKYAHLEGRVAAGEKFDLHKGSGTEFSFPLERVQFDHTPGDIWIVSQDRTTRLGRPNVTFGIDEFSRIPVSIHVSLAHPSSEELAEVVAQISMPKDEWLDEIGLEHINFPFFGIPKELFLDNAAEHKSEALKSACIARNIRLDWRNKTQDGGIIERLIGHAMVETRKLPGTTIFSVARRKEDQVDPSKFAEMTMTEYLRELVTYFWGEYTFDREHPALGMTPAQKWMMGMTKLAPRQVKDSFAYYLDFLPGHKCTCQKYGIQANHLRYSAPDFQDIVNDFLSEDIIAKIDPADVSRAFVRSPVNGKYIELHNHDMDGKGITRSQWKWHVEEVRQSIPRSDFMKNRKVTLAKIKFHVETGVLLSKVIERLETPSPTRTRREVRREEHNDNLKVRSARRLPAPIEMPAPLPPLLHKLEFVPFELG